jgi:glutamate dehydrogenase
VPVNGQLLLVFELQHLLRQAVRWFLRHGRYGGGVGATVERFAAAVRALEPRFGEEVTREEWQFVRDLAKSMRAAGVPPRLASRFAAMRITVAALEIASLSESSGRPLDRIADLFFEVSRRVRIPAAHRYANTLVSDNIWQDRARTGLMQELLALQGALTADALAFERPRMGAAAVVEAWAAGRTVELARYEEVLDELQYAEQVDLAMISVLVGKLYNLRAA